jgi:DNA-binding transcriptional ArsR family regulator
MAFSKSHLYPAELQKVSQSMKGFANPARLQTLITLLDHGPACVQDIATHHHISIEALSGHLAILREDRFVSFKERYPYTFYQIDAVNMKAAIDRIRSCMDRFDQKL